MEIANDLINILRSTTELFADKKINFCLAGGWAVGVWGAPRATEDIDLLILLEQNELNNISKILNIKFNVVQSHKLKFKSVTILRIILSLKNKKDLYILDLILADTSYYQNILKRKIYIEFEGTSIPLISLEDLIILKSISNRAQDQNDIKQLTTTAKTIDWNYINAAIKEFNLKIRNIPSALKCRRRLRQRRRKKNS
ncbi:nucleotidyltransferase, partial [candidate division KSB1 bacterium]|nr:nucleotidyltransferase [candidate division KSB1 bacterium]